ncbi:MAG: S1 RNA-binding domain-containing protein [bacterium]
MALNLECFKNDDLMHKSQMSKKFVKNPLDLVSVGKVIDVKGLKVDVERERIALSMVV